MMIEYLQNQIEKLELAVGRSRKPVMLFFEFCEGLWKCYYGWIEPYEGAYPIILSESHTKLNDAAGSLVRKIRPIINEINRFAEHHYQCGGKFAPIMAMPFIGGNETFEAVRITNVMAIEPKPHAGWGNRIPQISYNHNDHKCIMSLEDAKTSMWIKKK